MQPDFWYFKTFNPLFFAVFAAFLALLVVASILLNKRSDKAKRIVLGVACLVTLVGYFVYKYLLSKDTAYDAITQNMGGFNWWGELPFQLCNINLILIPIAVLTMKKPLLSFCFYIAPLGAMMAILMPQNGFNGYSLLLPRMLGFYGTHFMIIIAGLAIVTFGLYRPKFKDIPFTVLALVAVAVVVFGINLLLRATALHPKSNYFFLMEPEGISILELFRKWISVPFVYMLPSFLILVPYMALITFGFWIADRIKGAKRKHA